jgi:SpoVK/Ycf46/Vps4 family AAA+-type ATPase
MEQLKEYFLTEFYTDKRRIDRIDELVKNSLTSITRINSQTGIGYEIRPSDTINTKSQKEISASTNAMVLFVLAKMGNKLNLNSSLIPQIEWEINGVDKDKKFASLDKSIINIYELLSKSVDKTYSESSGLHITWSSTFGVNDPFTLSWLIEIALSQITTESTPGFVKKMLEICRKRILNAFDDPKEVILQLQDENGKEKEGYKSSGHIFPLIGIIHVWRSIQTYMNSKNEQFNEADEKIGVVRENLIDRINQQLSFSVISPSSFDTSELIMSLEGILLLEDNSQNINDALVIKIFEVVAKHQENHLYWRPLKPFVTTPTGHVLLPLSIEIANSLLRICKHLQGKNKFYFYNYFPMFQKYFDWLDVEMIKFKLEQNREFEYSGWHSEHVLEPNVIHPWETAQVIIYLMDYKALLQDQIAHKTFLMSRLTEKKLERSDEKFESFLKMDPLRDEKNIKKAIFEEIAEKFILCRDETLAKASPGRSLKINAEKAYSMLLFGPPGTGKSTIPEEIARALKWRLVTITPSDFLQTGESDIESNAKNIFKVLDEQKNCVILFDEIDRLLLDRDSRDYKSQDEVFKFMTPSMLVKLKELRTKGKTIFIIATNYAELIDPAIKRTGRIDEKYLINPPNLSQRLTIINNLINSQRRMGNVEEIHDIKIEHDRIEGLLKMTTFFTYGELKLYVNTLKIQSNEPLDSVIEKLQLKGERLAEFPSPSINLMSYRNRFSNKKHKRSLYQCPTEEFFMLIYLQCEAKKVFSKDEKKTILKAAKVVTKEKANIQSELAKVLQNEIISREIYEKCLKDILPEPSGN